MFKVKSVDISNQHLSWRAEPEESGFSLDRNDNALNLLQRNIEMQSNSAGPEGTGARESANPNNSVASVSEKLGKQSIVTGTSYIC